MYTYISLSIYIYIRMYTHIKNKKCLRPAGPRGVLFGFLYERLSIACVANPWPPVEETAGPHRVTNQQIKNLERKL